MLFYGSFIIFLFYFILFSFLLSTIDKIRDIEKPISQRKCVTSICFMREDIAHNRFVFPYRINGASGLARYLDAS